MSKRYSQRISLGFTLIEVLIAMSIIAISLIASVKASNQVTSNLYYLKLRSHGYFVAENVLTQLQMGNDGFYLSAGARQGQEVMDGKTWHWSANISGFSNRTLKIDIAVKDKINGDIVTRVTRYVHDNNQA